MQQVAWLNTAPRVKEGKALTRVERMRRDRGEGFEPEMPEPGGAAYLLRYLFEFGPVLSGPAEVSHQEIESWARLKRIPLTPWEAGTLRQLSRDYLVQARTSEEPQAPAPWKSDSEQQAEYAAQDMRAAIGRLAAM